MIEEFYKGTIIEYDMKQAGFSIIKKHSLLSKRKILKLEQYSKKQRNIEIGWLMREKDDSFTITIEDGIKQAKKDFCKINEISRKDIIDQNRDALFLLKPVFNLKVEKFIEFRKDNKYSLFFKLDRFIFLFSSWEKKLTIKSKINK